MRSMLTALLLAIAVACGGAKTIHGQPGSGTPPEPMAPKGEAPNEAAPATPPAATAAPARKLDKDETITTKSGASFTVAAGWSVAIDADGQTVAMTDPEGDLTMTFLEVAVADRDGAIGAAWAKVHPGFDLKVAQAQDLPGRDGWDAGAQIVYVTPSAELRVVVAVGLRKGQTWRVFLIDGKQAALGRRGAQLGTAVDSLKVPGLEKESFAGKTANPLDDKRLADLDAFVEESMQLADVPGAAIAIVQGGRVIHEKGFGVKELGKPGKVGPNTLFMTGSTGKSLTTLMMARAIDAGKFTWDTPVTELLPGFALGSAEVTKALLLHYTVCACTGMPRQDLEFIFEWKGITVEQRLDSMKDMTPTTAFGETFQYSNLLVDAGGFAAAHALMPKQKLGPAYDAVMQKWVFDPLGMKSTTYDFAKVKKGDHATPHAYDLTGTMTAFSLADELWTQNVRAAGGAWSSVHDYARVLLLELGKGKLDGKRLVSEENLLARRKPQVKINDELSYGMGLVVGTEYGVAVVQHGGNTAGFTTDYFWLPDQGVGVVIVANAGGANAFEGAVHRRVFELLFDGKARAHDDLVDWATRRKKNMADELALIKLDPDQAWFAGLVGAWVAPGLGRIELRVEKGKPVLDAGEWKSAVGQKTDRDGTVKIVTTSAPFVGFELIPRDKDGKPMLVLDDEQKSYSFERVPDKAPAAKPTKPSK
jgi:CubicO group peptidase (beta-lactamase class C family)